MDEDQAAACELRRCLYDLLGLAYYREPTRAFLDALASADFLSAAPFSPEHPEAAEGLRLLSISLESFRNGRVGKEVENLQLDYFRLFIGAGTPAAPPWESYYRTEERLLCSHYTLDVRSWYERFGLVSDCRDKEPEDHIGLELEFMAHLCDGWKRCCLRGDEKGAAAYLEAQRGFLEAHLLEWASSFCRDVVRFAETPFFAGLAGLTEGFLCWDGSFVNGLLRHPVPARSPDRQGRGMDL